MVSLFAELRCAIDYEATAQFTIGPRQWPADYSSERRQRGGAAGPSLNVKHKVLGELP